MNARPDAIAASTTTPPARGASGSRSAALAARAWLVLAACGIAHSQEPAAPEHGVARLVARDAIAHLAHPRAEVRGEAALVVAARADFAQQATLLQLSADREPAARQRALIALGALGTPAAVQRLADVLEDTTTRGNDDGTAAAFGLGLVPENRATTTTTRVLAAIAQGSWKRQRETLLGLLVAMRMQPERAEALALRRLFDDDSNRDADVRGLLLELLLRHDKTLDARFMRRCLERGSDPERAALLTWLADENVAIDPLTVPTLERLAGSAVDPTIRAGALGVLTRANHLPALDLALRSLRSPQPVACEQALRTLLTIGGARMLRAFAPNVVAEPDAQRKAAWLAHWPAPLTPELDAHCRKLAVDVAQPWSLRTAATLALARGSSEPVAPLLRDVFRGTMTERELPTLATLLRRHDPEPTPLDRLLEGGTDLREHPRRWSALLRVEHPEAERQVLLGLQAPGGDHERVLPALRAWRAARVLHVPAGRSDTVPPLLRDLLGGE